MANLTNDERQFLPPLEHSWQQYLAPILRDQLSPGQGGRVRYRTSPTDPESRPERLDAKNFSNIRLNAWYRAQKFTFENGAWYSSQRGGLKRRVLAISDVVSHTWELFLRLRPTKTSGPRAPGLKCFHAAVDDNFVGIESGDIKHLHRAFAHALSGLKEYRTQELSHREHSAPQANAMLETPVLEGSNVVATPGPDSPSQLQPAWMIASPSTPRFGQVSQPGWTTSQHEALLHTTSQNNAPTQLLNPPRTGFSLPGGPIIPGQQQYPHNYGSAVQDAPAGDAVPAVEDAPSSSSRQSSNADDFGTRSSGFGPLPTPLSSSTSFATEAVNTSNSPFSSSLQPLTPISARASSLDVAGKPSNRENDLRLSPGLAVPGSPPLSPSGSPPLTPTPSIVAEEERIIALTDENSACYNGLQAYHRLSDERAVNQQDVSTRGMVLHDIFHRQSEEIEIRNQRLHNLQVRARARRRSDSF